MSPTVEPVARRGALDRGAQRRDLRAPLRLRASASPRRLACRAARRRGAPAMRSRVTGKGSKERIVPVLPAVARGHCRVSEALPVEARHAPAPLFLGAEAGRLNPRIVQRAMERLRGVARPAADRHAARAPPFLRHPPPRQWRRPPRHPGTPRPRQPVDHPDLYASRHRPADGGLQRGASAGVTAWRAASRRKGQVLFTSVQAPPERRRRSEIALAEARQTPFHPNENANLPHPLIPAHAGIQFFKRLRVAR